MSGKQIGVPGDVYDYLVRVGVREPEILARLRQETANHPGGAMQVPPEEGAFLALLACSAVALGVALALPRTAARPLGQAALEPAE